MKRVLPPVDDNRVAGVGATVEASTYIVVLSEYIDKLSLSFIAPLTIADMRLLKVYRTKAVLYPKTLSGADRI